MSDHTCFLGLDSSTQGIKATVIDEDLTIVAEARVNYDADLPEFGTDGGVHRGADGLTVTSPTTMWVAALELVLERLGDTGFELGSITAVSGSGQQHGSVWMRSGAQSLLHNLSPSQPLREQLASAFAVPHSPIWMDSSTSAQCAALEQALGGPQAVAELTGSRAYERFTGNQIAKIYQQNRAAYEDTERILLVSSFIASLLAGRYVGIDTSDGSGMNLLDIRTKRWAPAALEHTAQGLEPRLGEVVPGHHCVGTIAPYFVERFGFDQHCLVIAFSGDNPCSLAGLRLQHPGDVAISLGTSDTMFGSVATPRPSAHEGHIFANPVDPDGYMAMICYKNGSLTREHVRDTSVTGTWEHFNRAVRRTPPGNNGYLGFYIKEPEITPPIMTPGIYRFDTSETRIDSFPEDVDSRAVLESQFLSMRVHCGNIGLAPRTILATGGASQNECVLQVIADVFGAAVATAEVSDSAALGAAYRALHGWQCEAQGAFVPFAQVFAAAPEFITAAKPDPAAHRVYTDMIEQFKRLETQVIAVANG